MNAQQRKTVSKERMRVSNYLSLCFKKRIFGKVDFHLPVQNQNGRICKHPYNNTKHIGYLIHNLFSVSFIPKILMHGIVSTDIGYLLT